MFNKLVRMFWGRQDVTVNSGQKGTSVPFNSTVQGELPISQPTFEQQNSENNLSRFNMRHLRREPAKRNEEVERLVQEVRDKIVCRIEWDHFEREHVDFDSSLVPTGSDPVIGSLLTAFEVIDKKTNLPAPNDILWRNSGYAPYMKELHEALEPVFKKTNSEINKLRLDAYEAIALARRQIVPGQQKQFNKRIRKSPLEWLLVGEAARNRRAARLDRRSKLIHEHNEKLFVPQVIANFKTLLARKEREIHLAHTSEIHEACLKVLHRSAGFHCSGTPLYELVQTICPLAIEDFHRIDVEKRTFKTTRKDVAMSHPEVPPIPVEVQREEVSFVQEFVGLGLAGAEAVAAIQNTDMSPDVMRTIKFLNKTPLNEIYTDEEIRAANRGLAYPNTKPGNDSP